MAENNELAVILRFVADQCKSELQSLRGAIGQLNDLLKDWHAQLSAVSAALFAVAKSSAEFDEEVPKRAQKTAGRVVGHLEMFCLHDLYWGSQTVLLSDLAAVNDRISLLLKTKFSG